MTEKMIKGVVMSMSLLKLLSKRPVHQTLQGIIVGGLGRTVNDYGTAPYVFMYGAGKYIGNNAIENAQIGRPPKYESPFEKYSSFKKTGWYALGVCISHADQIYIAGINLFDKLK